MARAVRLEQLGWAFGADREFGFTAWTLATPDPLAAVLAPGYFCHCATRFRPGDLLFCASGQPGAGQGTTGDPAATRHRCLLLVTRIGGGEVAVRLAQDWGSPAAAAQFGSGVAPESGGEAAPPAVVDTVLLPRQRRALGLGERAGVGAVRRRAKPPGRAGRAKAAAAPAAEHSGRVGVGS